jgi:hypothetical protein
MALTHLDDRRRAVVTALCATIVPGSERVEPAVYVDGLLGRMPEGARAAAIAAFDGLEDVAGDPEGMAERVATPEFAMVRAMAIEAFYSDFVAPGAAGPGAWEEIDFHTPLALRLDKDWSYLIGASA